MSCIKAFCEVNKLKIPSEYQDDYEIIEIKGKTLIIFDDHNKALPIWGLLSNSLNSSCQLFTFDSHCDTRLPFTHLLSNNGEQIDKNYQKKYCVAKVLYNKKFTRNNFCFDDTYLIASKYLKNDEHIKTAFDWGYISNYNIITSDSEYKDCQKNDTCENYLSHYFHKNLVQENNFKEYDDNPIILDFDLDFFTNADDFIAMKRLSSLSNLIKKSEIITIAREPKYFESCKLNKDDNLYTNQKALDLLRELIENLL